MPKIVREDIDNLNAVLSITLEKADYSPRLDVELKKYQQKASFKGFRKGKTPKRMLKKFVGKSVLAEIINELLQKELIAFMTKEDNLLGQPLPSEEHEEPDLNIMDLQDYEFKFDIGLSPEFEVQGLSSDHSFRKYVVEIPDEQVEEQLEAARRRFGERIFPDDVQEGDFIKLSVRELENGELKEEGVESDFGLLIESIAEEETKQEFLSKKLGDVFTVNLLTLEKDRDEKYVRKYYLNLNDEDEQEVENEFEATIEEISRMKMADLDQAFFDKYFGEGEVNSEEEAREKIRKQIRRQYDVNAEALMYRDLQEHLQEQNQMPLPDAFLKRWLVAVNDNLNAEKVEEEYDEKFSKTMQWSLVRNKLIEQFDLKVTAEQIKAAFTNRLLSMLGNNPGISYSFIEDMADRMMKDENNKQRDQIADELLDDQMYVALAEEITIAEEPISIEDFEKVVEEARAQIQEAEGETDEEE